MGAAGGDTNYDGQYVFSSSPTLPREKTPDILVKFKAASSDQSCILGKTFYVSSSSTLIEVRRKIHKTFASCYEKGFIFLDKNTEVLRSRERIIRIFDILPKPPRRDLNSSFKFTDVQYKKISYEKDGRRFRRMCVGVVFLFEDSGLYRWSPSDLKTSLSGPTTDAFSFIPSSVTSLGDTITGIPLDRLNYSASKGSMGVLRKILQTLPTETDPRHLKDNRRATPLHYAAQSGHLDACELLIGQFGRDLMYMKDMNMRTPLHCALTYNKPDVIVYLLQLGPDLDCRDVHGLTCRRMLLTLSNESTATIIPRLDPGLLDDMLILHFACYTIQFKMVELAKIYCRYVPAFESSFYRPPLHLAAELGDEEIVKILLGETNIRQSKECKDTEGDTFDDEEDLDETSTTQHDPEDKDPDGYLPFHYACQHGHANIVSLLYFESMKNDDFVKGIHLAVSWKKYNLLDILISLREEFVISNATKEMLIKETEMNFSNLAMHFLPCLKNEKRLLNRFLQQAAYHGTVDVLKWLLDHAVEIDLRDFMGRTALHNGIQCDQNEIVKVLLKHGANPNVRDWQKSTPLHYACCLGHVGTCRALLKCESINPGLQDSCGRTPIMVAASKKHDKLMDYLIKNHLDKMNPKAVDSNRQSLLHYMVFLRGKTAEALIKKLSTIAEPLPAGVPPLKYVSTINLYEMWTDWSQINLDVACPAMVRPKKTSRTVTQMRCARCGKRWTLIRDKKRRIHVCRALKKDGQLQIDKLSKEEDAVICQSISRPFQRFSTDECIDIPLLHLLIIHNRSDLIHTVNVYQPEVFQKHATSAAVLAAKRWSLSSLMWLDKTTKFTKDQLNTLLLVALLNDACDQKEEAKQLDVVKQLIEMGATPNYIPTSLEVFTDLIFSSTEKSLLLYSPLELASLKQKEHIIDVLLRHDASTLTCFAIHFAVWKGNTKIVSTLLTHRRKELQSDTATGDISGSFPEYKRICSQGIFQAAACGSGIMKNMFSILTSLAPELLQSRSLLTLNMILEIRPSINISQSSPVNSFAFSLIDKATFSVLPLTKLIQNIGKCIGKINLETIVPQLLDGKVHLGEVRITKSSSVHCVCEAFDGARRKRLWKVVDSLLVHAGSMLWKCLLSENEMCHKYVYFEYDKKPTSPIMLKQWQEFFKYAPLEILTNFFKIGQTVVNSMNVRDIQRIVVGDSKSEETVISKSDILSHIAWFHIQETTSRSRQLVATKLLHIFPKLFPKYISEVYSSSCNWLSAVTRSEVEKTFNSYKHLKIAKAFVILQQSTKEATLMKSLGQQTSADLNYMKTNEITMLQYAAAIGDLDLAKCCLSTVDPLVVASRGKDDIVPLAIAAALADNNMVDLLLKHGHAVGQQSLSAACCGKEFLKLMPWVYSVPRDQMENRKLDILMKFESSANHSFWQDHKHNGTVLRFAISMGHWEIAEHMLSNEEHHTSLTSCPDVLIVKLAVEAPTKLCRLLLDQYKVDMVKLVQNIGGVLLMFMSKMRTDDTLEMLLRVMFEDCNEDIVCKQLAEHMSYSDRYKDTAIHYLCQKGKYEAVCLITAKLGRNGYSSLQTILNMKDRAKATPLWYAMAGKHWNIAEHILLNGGGLSALRSIPDWKAKRQFTVVVNEDNVQSPSPGKITKAAWSRNASSETAFSFAIHHRPPKFVKRPCAPKRADAIITEIQIRRDKEADTWRQKINYLLSLWKFSELTSSTMVHAAAAVGDVQLMESLLKLPMYGSGLCDVHSPMLFAVANGQISTASLCVEKILCSQTEPDLLDALAMCLCEAYGFKNINREIAVQTKKYKFSEEITNDIKDISNKMAKPSITVKKTLLNSAMSLLEETELQQLAKLVLGENTVSVPDSLLLVSALVGKSWLVDMFQQYVHDCSSRSEMYSRKVTHHLTVLHLMFVFARCNVGKDENSDMLERAEILKLFRTDTELSLKTDVLRIAVQKNLFLMLHTVIEDSLDRGIQFTTNTHWETHLLTAGSLGLEISVKTLIRWMETTTSQREAATQKEIQQLLETLLSVCCLNGHRELVEYLIDHGVSVSAITKVPSKRKPKSAIDCAVINGNLEIIDICIKAFGDKWEIPSTNCLHIAAAVCGTDILDKLLKSKRYARFSTKSFSEELMLVAAQHGSESNCIHLISNRVLDVLKTDNKQFTILHYACLYNMRQLAENILKSTKEAVKMVDKSGMTPLDIARSMGNIDIALQLGEISLIDFHQQTHMDLNLTGWLKHALGENAQKPTSNQILMPKDITILGDFRKMRTKYKMCYIDGIYKIPQTERLDLNLPSLLGMKDDNGACAMLDVAQETVVQTMKMSYSRYPLLHLCAIMGCDKSLKLLLELIKKYSVDGIATWTRKSCQRGKIPIVYAIENRQIECVKILFAEDDCLDWLGDNCGETILHHVAKVGSEEITTLITEKATDDRFSVRDKHNCIPAALCVAHGHHSILTYMLKGFQLDGVDHIAHVEMDFSCVDCLLDRCIGWSRMFVCNTDISTKMPHRNIMKREHFRVGYVPDGTGHLTHPLTDILAWSAMSSTSKLLDVALTTMRYSPNPAAAQIFVLMNSFKSNDVRWLIFKSLECGFDDAACYLFKENADVQAVTEEFYLKAIANHKNMFFSTIISETDVLSKSQSALDVAFGFGNIEAARVIEKNNGHIETDHVTTLAELANVLPLSTRWRIGLAQPGDDNWSDSLVSQTKKLTDILPLTYPWYSEKDIEIGLVISQTHRMSEADVFLSLKPDDHFRQIMESLPITSESILPQNYLEKEIRVDIKSFEAAGHKCDIKGILLYSIILSKLVMGRYHLEIDLESVCWKALKTLVISCVQDEMSEVPQMKVHGRELHDRVWLRKTDDPEGNGQKVVVDTAEVPVQLSNEETQRTEIQETVIPEVEWMITKIIGHTITVEVDWASVDAVKERQCRQHVLMVLTGEHGQKRLGGLETMILKSGFLLESIAAFGGDATANRAMSLIEVIKHIVVRYVDVLPTEKKTIFSSNDSKIFWYFSLKDLSLHYKSSLFALYKTIEGYHTVWHCITDCLLSLKDNLHEQLDEITAGSKDKKRVEVHIDVRSFEESGISDSIVAFFQNKVTPIMKRIASAYKFKLRLKLDVNKLKVLATVSKEKSGIVFKDGILTICLLLSRPMTGAWQVDDLDWDKIFTDMEVKQIKDIYPNNCDDLMEKVKMAGEEFKNAFGISLDIGFNCNDWLEDVSRVDNRVMTHPVILLTSYVNTFAYHTLASYEDAIIKELTTADCWLLKNIELPCGFWCSFNYSVLDEMSETRTFLVKTRHEQEFNLKKHVWTDLAYDGTPNKTKFIDLTAHWWDSDEFGAYKRIIFIYEVLTHAELQKRYSNSLIGLWYLIPIDRATKYDRIQLLSLRNMLFYIPDNTFASRFASGLKTKIQIRSRYLIPKGKTSEQALYLSFDDIGTDEDISVLNRVIQKEVKSFADHIKPYTDVGYMLYLIWIAAGKLGMNLFFDLKGFQQKSALAIVAHVVLMTLDDLSPNNDRVITEDEKQVKNSFLKALSNLGTVSVGFQCNSDLQNTEMGSVEGSNFDELADITFVFQSDLHINFRSAILVSDKHLQPITETLRSALCKSFEGRAPTEVRKTLSDVVNINLTDNSIMVPNFHRRKDNVNVLHAVSTSMSNFDQAMRYVVENHENATNRLKSELKGVVLKEYGSHVSVATFTEGVLECTMLKGGDNVTVEEMQSDIVAALGNDLLPEGPRFKSKMLLPLFTDYTDTDSVLTVTCSQKIKRQRPKLQRLKRPKGTSTRAIENSTVKLFYHVQIGQTGNIENELDIGANIDHRGENGATPLLRACQLRNYVVQSLLVSRGANVNKSDKFRRTPLHYEAAHGDVQSVELLLTHKAKVNARDKDGRTPLHYAVNKSQFEAVDLLVFCGADSSILDKKKQSPASRCRHPKLCKLMMESQMTVHGIQNGYIHIEYITMEANMSYHLPNIDLSMRTPSSLGTGIVSMVWRRVQPEYSRTDLAPADKELLMSDVFEYRMSGTDVTENIILKIPVYSKVDRFEEVYMKTDKENYIGRLEIRQEKKDHWVCYVKVNLSSMNAFVLVTLPKKEVFPLTSAGGTFTSNVATVEILVKPDTFEKTGDLTLEIIPKPAIEEEEFDKVLSLSHFYDLCHSEGEQPSKEIIMTVPLPHDYFGDGALYVMIRHELEDYEYEEDLWEILDRNPPVHDGMVNISVPHFSECNLLEYKGLFEVSTISDFDKAKLVKEQDKEIIRKNAKLLEKAKRRECSVVFMAMLKTLPNSGMETIIECTRNNQRNTRLQYWKNEGYQDQNPSYTSDFVTFPKQEFKFDIGGNAKKDNPVITKLQYHPKRHNILKVPISLVNSEKDKVGWVDIGQKQENLEKQFEENPNYGSLAQIFLHLLQFDSKRSDGVTHTSESVTEEEKAFEGFTNETLLKDLARDLDSQWKRVALLLGFSDRSINKKHEDQEETEEEHRYRLLKSWRDNRLHRRDHGVPELLIALQKSERKDLVRNVIQTLKEWLGDKAERRDKFMVWLQTAFSGTPDTNEEHLQPMSDAFISHLVKETGVVLELASELDVSKPELDLINCDQLAHTPESKMIKLFVTSRDKHTSDDQAFQTTVEALTSFSMEKPRNWMLQTAREWANSVEKTDDPFVHHICDYLDIVEPLYMPLPVVEEEEEEEENKDNTLNTNLVEEEKEKEENKDNTLNTNLVEEEENKDNTLNTNLVEEEENKDNTLNTNLVEEEENKDNTLNTNLVEEEQKEEEENKDNTLNTNLVVEEENKDNTLNTNLVKEEEKEEENKDNTLNTNLVEEEKEENKDNTLNTNLVVEEENKDNTLNTNLVEEEEKEEEENKDNTLNTNLVEEENKDNTLNANLVEEEEKEENKDNTLNTNLVEEKEENKDNTLNTNLVEDKEEENKDNTLNTNLVEDKEEENKDNTLNTNLVEEKEEENKDNTLNTNLVEEEEKEEENKDNTLNTNLVGDV